MPACVIGRRTDLLAWNDLADALYGFSTMDPVYRNVTRHTFGYPGVREFYQDWEGVAAETVAFLRLEAGQYPNDPRLAALIGELTMRSKDFARLWAKHPLQDKTHGSKTIVHPIVGELDLAHETCVLPGDPARLLVAYTAAAGSPTADRLRLLASWNAPSEQKVLCRPSKG
ncbi:hypothetical protein MJQ72_20445 [Amycolatopsis sp. EV170708-02-1]|nr:hypothetical protein [Amycolatopsis sp. EV170708-02-1]UMP07034.1 hypothetical protein MJQ72_20445 [Amycolatopsis sp. EV170708-02-1]